MSKLCQRLARPVQQFSADTTILKIRKQRNDFYLSSFTRAEAESNYSPIDDADVTRQHTRADILSPGVRCDANGA
ncbi:MAG: hypothetical protein WBM87_03590 [Woeseiaceae bacterium]